MTTGKDGKFGPIKLKVDGNYLVMSKKANFLTNREEFSMNGREIPQSLLKKPITDTTFYTSLNLEPIFVGKTFRVDNIYYDLDKWDIRTDAALELDKLVQVMNEYPNMVIFAKSHTDSRGKDKYNLDLSDRRAKSTVQYLISKGISKDRISGQGFGETEPKVICEECTEEEHAQNRRSEFLIVKK